LSTATPYSGQGSNPEWVRSIHSLGIGYRLADKRKHTPETADVFPSTIDVTDDTQSDDSIQHLR